MKNRPVVDIICQRSMSGIHRFLISPMRKWAYTRRGAKFGAGTEVQPMILLRPHQLSVGNNCDLRSGIYFEHTGVHIPGPNIIIGDRTFIGYGCKFIIQSTITIHEDCLIAAGCHFTDIKHGFEDKTRPMNVQECTGTPISIEKDVWLGTNVTVLPGVSIGYGSIVGAGSVVTKSIPPCEIWAGVPAKKIRNRFTQDSADPKIQF